MNKILARFPSEAEPTLWLLPAEGAVFLTHRDYNHSTTFIRICSWKEYKANCKVLVKEGWILEKDGPGKEARRTR
jgi:hypothetical protein